MKHGSPGKVAFTDDEALWERVQAALDQRRDPRLDVEVQQAILDDPESFQALDAWLRTLECLPPRPRTFPLRKAAAAAALVAVAAAGMVLWRALRPTQPAPVQPSVLAEAVYSLEWTVTRETTTSRSTTIHDELGITARTESFDLTSGTAVLTSEVARAGWQRNTP